MTTNRHIDRHKDILINGNAASFIAFSDGGENLEKVQISERD